MIFPSRATQIEEEVQQRSLESAQEFRRRVHISVDHSDDVINDHPRDNVEILRSVRNLTAPLSTTFCLFSIGLSLMSFYILKCRLLKYS